MRTSLVRVRTALINSVRGILRAHGYRMNSCLAGRFEARFVDLKIEAELHQVLDPLVATLAGEHPQAGDISPSLRRPTTMATPVTVRKVCPRQRANFIQVAPSPHATPLREVGLPRRARPTLELIGMHSYR